MSGPVPVTLLTDSERERGVRSLHELSGARQAEVQAAIKAGAAAETAFGVAVG